ncbi:MULTISPECIES: MurR/RpiR family transcriptional regulator [Pseudomonas]|uniref:Transcriptional regulator, RpiR family n=1 Tax=Pseudomonas asplenii TaxID=53407 RepID=A0A0N0VIF1_9PSED|nr:MULTISPECIES: MurR/RpiR family transcriptional regulator [Pseudomonas]KPA87926.1 transcriptional regulator, RpiR family [Pseudomonas fuscovaginae]KPA95584.1 transcriptional regulator, RpiR family [Pseudomonas fuscovaginae]
MSKASEQLPETVSGLKELLAAIERQEVDIALGSSSTRVLTSLIESPQRAAVSSISELAEQLGVNASTLSRLARRLGYSGFSKLQDVFRRELTEGKSFYSDQASRLVVGHDDSGALSQLARLGRQESANIASMVEQVDPETFGQVVARLSTARRVRIHGMRQFNSLALFMSYGLGMLRPDVSTLDSSRQGVADALAQMDAGDVLVVASCFPYTPSVLATAEVAARHGIDVIALTDSASSPLAKSALHSFYVPNHSLFFSNSMCAFMLLAQGLLSAVASSLGEASVEALRYREKLISELNASL